MRIPRLRRLLAATALVTTAVVPLSATPALAITCYSATSGAAASFYAGPSASYRYDARFAAGPAAVPQSVLDRYVPQGLATWANWNGTGATLLVYTAYAEDGGRALLQGVDAATGARTRVAYVPSGHVGGLAFTGGHAWIASDGVISRYSLAALRAAFRGGASGLLPTDRTAVPQSSFLTSYAGLLYAGRFNAAARDVMTTYRITTAGELAVVRTSQVPMKAQGIVVTGTHVLFSTSYGRNNRSNIYVVRRGSSLDSAGASCFRAPSMSEGMTLHGGRVYVLYESGAHLYNKGLDDPLNPIKRLHQSPIGNLTSLVG